MTKIVFEHCIFLHQTIGGISKYICKINKAFQNSDIKSTIYSPISINDNLKISENNNIVYFKFKKIPIFFTKIFYFINNLATIIFINFYKPDIIHFTYYNNFLYKFISTPYVLTIYDLINEKKRHSEKKFKKNELIKKASHIICISNETKKNLIKFYNINKKNISVIYLGTEKNIPLIVKKKDYILFVGSRFGYKNFLNFIKAYSKSEYLVKNYKVLCFGSENFDSNEIQLFNKLKIQNNIIFKTGNDKILERIYRNASLFLSTSKQEGFGLTPLEAMRCGCPTLCSNIPVFKEILGNSCEYTNPYKINDIKSKMEKILKSKIKQKTLIKHGFLKTQQFSWEKCSSETINVYKKILN